MIRLMGLISEKTRFLSEEDNAPDERLETDKEDPRDDMGQNTLTGGDGNMVKAQLLNLQKQITDLYNMIGEDEGLDGWVVDKLAMAADYINAIHNHIQYEKTAPASLGDGEGSPVDRLPPDTR